MKLTSIEMHPANFTGLVSEMPRPDYIFITAYTYSESGDEISSIFRIDPVTYEIVEREPFALPKAISNTSTYRLLEVKAYNGKIYVLGKSNAAFGYDGPPVFGDYWAFIEFSPENLTSRIVHGIGSNYGGVSNHLSERESLLIRNGTGYISQMALDPDTNIEILSPFYHNATYGYSLSGGDTVFRNDHGVFSDNGRQKNFAIARNVTPNKPRLLDSSRYGHHLHVNNNASIESTPGLFSANAAIKNLNGNHIVLNHPFDGSALGGDFFIYMLIDFGTESSGTILLVDLASPSDGSRITVVCNNDIDLDIFTMILTRTAGDFGTAEVFNSDGTDLSVTGPHAIHVGYDISEGLFRMGFDGGQFAADTGIVPGPFFEDDITSISFGESSSGIIFDEIAIFSNHFLMGGSNAVTLQGYFSSNDFSGFSSYLSDVFFDPIAYYHLDDNLVIINPSFSTYHIGELDFSYDSRKIYKGSLNDPFNSLWFDGPNAGDIYGEIDYIAVDPDNGHVFCWIADYSDVAPAFWYILELDEDGSVVQTIDVVTSGFTIDRSNTISGVICIHGGLLYVSIYLVSVGSANELADSVWVIDPSGPTGNNDPAFSLGESAEFVGGSFDFDIISGIEYFSGSSGGSGFLPDVADSALVFSFRDPRNLNPYNVKTISGLDSDAFVSTYHEEDGFKYYTLSMEKRDVVIRAALNPDFHDGESYSDLRDAVYRLISTSRLGKVYLYFKNEADVVAVLSGFVSKVESPLFEKTSDVEITISCDDPMLKAPIATSVSVTGLDPANTVITDLVSTAPHGFAFQLHIMIDFVDVIIMDPYNPLWQFRIAPEGGFVSGDQLFFSSEVNNKYLYILRGSDIIQIVPESFVWPILFPGTNLLNLTNSGSVVWVSISYYETYWGV